MNKQTEKENIECYACKGKGKKETIETRYMIPGIRISTTNKDYCYACDGTGIIGTK